MAQTGMKRTKKIIIGITGGAGSGKSTVVECIQSHFDVDFMHCDIIAHELMEPGKASYKALIKEYGKGILTDGPDSAIDRVKLTDVLRESAGGYKRLNEITHPRVIKEVEKRIKASKKDIILVEAALLIEAGMTGMCDDVWYVHATDAERIDRIKKSRGWSDKKIADTLNNQLSHEEFLKNTTFVIENHDNSEEGLEKAVKRVEFLRG